MKKYLAKIKKQGNQQQEGKRKALKPVRIRKRKAEAGGIEKQNVTDLKVKLDIFETDIRK